jgi:hypothetical protein
MIGNEVCLSPYVQSNPFPEELGEWTGFLYQMAQNFEIQNWIIE